MANTEKLYDTCLLKEKNAVGIIQHLVIDSIFIKVPKQGKVNLREVERYISYEGLPYGSYLHKFIKVNNHYQPDKTNFWVYKI